MSLPRSTLGRIRVTVTGKSARQFAEEIGMPVRTLRAIENADHVPTEQERQAIAAALGCTPWEIGL